MLSDKQELLNQIDMCLGHGLPAGAMVTFQVGKSKWKVTNGRESLTAFRKKVVARWRRGSPSKTSKPADTTKATIMDFLESGESLNALQMMRLKGIKYVFGHGSRGINLFMVSRVFTVAGVELVVCTCKRKEHFVLEETTGLSISCQPSAKLVVLAATNRIEDLGVEALKAKVTEGGAPTEQDFIEQENART